MGPGTTAGRSWMVPIAVTVVGLVAVFAAGVLQVAAARTLR